jgi:hypothetical protein
MNLWRGYRSQIKVRVVVDKEGLTFLVQREVDEEDAMMMRRQCLVGGPFTVGSRSHWVRDDELP